ncbi:MAG: hypothetical protein U1E78_12090 [Gammaproteobacteria bacterium]
MSKMQLGRQEIRNEGSDRYKCAHVRDILERPTGEILEYWAENLFLLVVSKEIFSEYKRVAEILSKKYKSR